MITRPGYDVFVTMWMAGATLKELGARFRCSTSAVCNRGGYGHVFLLGRELRAYALRKMSPRMRRRFEDVT